MSDNKSNPVKRQSPGDRAVVQIVVTPQQSRRIRIPLRQRAVENPSERQLVFWALRENILQRLAPHEAMLPPVRISFNTLMRLRTLYNASVERWRAKEAAERAARPPTKPLAELLADALAALPFK
jgi:hypothetical protein